MGKKTDLQSSASTIGRNSEEFFDEIHGTSRVGAKSTARPKLSPCLPCTIESQSR